MRAVDTNVLVRLIVGDDARQASAAEAFVGEGAWVPMLALAEASWVLVSVYGSSDAQIAGALAKLLDHKQLQLQDPDVVAAALQQYRKRTGIGFSDCLLLEVARKSGHLPLGTFDRSLAKLEGAVRV